jgi:hypothetical protein
MVKSNTKSRPSLTPRSTTDGSAGYCTLSAGQGTKVQTKNTPGCQLQNSNTLKNSYQTSMPNTRGSPVPSRFDSPTPTSSDTHTPLKKTSFPIHSTSFPFIPSSSDTHNPSVKQNPCTPTTFHPLPTSLQEHYPPSLSVHPTTPTSPTLTTPTTKPAQLRKHSHSPLHLPTTHNLQHSHNSEPFCSLPATLTLTLLHKKK